MSRRLALIMAGGGGTRLWPASIPTRPKQVIPGLPDSGATLLSATAARLEPLVRREDVWVVTTQDQVDGVRDALPFVDQSRIVVEPFGRNTAPAVALSLVQMRARLGDDADEVTVIALPADHFVGDPAGFRAHLGAACAHAEAANTVATLGIEPARPDTGYGYMERGNDPRSPVTGDEGVPVYPALRFVEKPDLETARQYLATGRFVWNAGIFAMPLPRIERDFARLCGDTWRALHDAAPAEAYARIEAAPIDVAVMEKLDDIVVVPTAVGWSDLGSWASIADALAGDDAGNVVRTGANARTAVLDARDCVVWNEDATVGVIGVSGLAVVAAGGRILVCALDQAQRVRALVDALRDDDPAKPGAP